MTRLQKLFKGAFIKSATNNGFTLEDWDKAIHKFGIECYVKAAQGKLIELDYKNEVRLVRGKTKCK